MIRVRVGFLPGLVLGVLLCAPLAHAQEADLEIEADDTSPPPPPAPDPQGELQASIRGLEERLRVLEEAAAPPVPPEPPAPPVEEPVRRWQDDVRFSVHGWVQPQVMWNQASVDEVDPDGNPLNQDHFVVRRGRLEIGAAYKYASARFEIDANTVYGPQVGVRGAEGALFVPRPEEGATPYAQLTAGMFDIPFGFTTTEDADDRFFMERTVGSRALFPGDSDVGVMLSGAPGPLRLTAAVLNGVPIQENPAADTTVKSAKKTFVGRAGFALADDGLNVTGGVSYLAGTGFHEGTPATKSSLLWSDTNQDGLVTLNELTSVNGQASTPSATFPQWGVSADAEAAIDTPLGTTWLYGEVILASNLDRALYAADPLVAGYDLREVAWNVGAVQGFLTYGLVGFRADGYQPDADQTEARRGLFLPTDAQVLTLSPLVGAQLRDVGRLVLQYDYVSDHLGRDVRGEPIDFPNDQWTLRMQVEF